MTLPVPDQAPVPDRRLLVSRIPSTRLAEHADSTPPLRARGAQHAEQGFLVFSVAPEDTGGYGTDWEDVDFGPQRTPATELPDPVRFAAGLGQALLEIIDGTRPAANYARWFSPSVFEEVSERAAEALRRRWDPRTRRTRPVSVQRRLVRRVRACQVAPSIVEASVVVAEGARCRALALRLEGLDRRWRTTAVLIVE